LDGHGNEFITNPNRYLATCETEDGEPFQTDLRQNVKHAYRDKTEKERSNLIKALIRSIKRTGGHIDLDHNDGSNLGWIPDKDVIERCESEKILANYVEFGEEQGIWS